MHKPAVLKQSWRWNTDPQWSLMPNPGESHVLSFWGTITSIVPTRDMPLLVDQFRDAPFFVSMATSFTIM